MKKVLITGCSGLVGTHLIKKCIDAGYEVTGTDLYRSEFLPIDGWLFIKKDLTIPMLLKIYFRITISMLFSTHLVLKVLQ